MGYAANDVVLIVLWVMASMENPAYIPVAVNFAIFLLNDLYGFVSWKSARSCRRPDIFIVQKGTLFFEKRVPFPFYSHASK